MYKQNPRPTAPTSVGPASGKPLTPADPSPTSIVSIRAAPLRGPASLPGSAGAIPFGAPDGELMTSAVDAHSRSEAAYPIVGTFMAHFARPAKLNGHDITGSTMAIAKGQPLLFVSMPRDQDRSNAGVVINGSAFSTECMKLGMTRRGAHRKDQERFACFVGDDNSKHAVAFTGKRVFSAVAAEPQVVHFDSPTTAASQLTAVAACLEHRTTVFVESLENPTLAGTDYAAGTSIMIGAEGTSAKAYAGTPNKLAEKCKSGFRPLRHAIALVPFRRGVPCIPIQASLSAGVIPV